MAKRRKTKEPGVVRETSPQYGREAPANRSEALEMRCETFARAVRVFLKRLPLTTSNREDGRQVVRSSGSIGANYIEANESLGKKDFLLHVKISRKEAKESRYWLRLLDCADTPDLEAERQHLIQEATELMNVFGAIYRNSE
jgi:four helix bundle protein